MKALSMRQRARKVLLATWDAIGHDVLEATGGQEMEQADVIEAVLDADHYVNYGDDPEAIQYIKELPDFRARFQLGLESFEGETYGL